jgi:hypothetical protein
MKVQEINQVKLGGYSSNKGCLYTGDRGKSIYSKGMGVGVHQDCKRQKGIGCERVWQPERVSRSDKVRKSVHPQEKGKQGKGYDVTYVNCAS